MRKGRSRQSRLRHPGRYDVAIWLDYDHDYDLDLLLLGETNILRNEGDLVTIPPTSLVRQTTAPLLRLVPDTKVTDWPSLESGRDARDKLAGKWAADLSALQRRDINRRARRRNSGTVDLL
jgi:hypothetical protein